MANPGYVRSTDGSDADNGASWAAANATLAGAMSDQAAGDRVWVSDNHAESTAGAVTVACPGTVTSPCEIYGGDDAAEPPTALSTAPTVTTTGTASITYTGHFTMSGISHFAGTGAGSSSINLGNGAGNVQVFKSCAFRLVSTGASGRVAIGATASQAPSRIVWEMVDVRFANASQGITLAHCDFDWKGGSILSGGTSPTSMFYADGSNRAGVHNIEGVDFSNANAGVHLVGVSTAAAKITFRYCKLPASWSGNLYNGTPIAGLRVEMYNCDGGDSNYRLWIEDYCGYIKSETTIVRSGGATDGATPLSWRMTTNASNARFPIHVLESGDIAVWNDTVGSPITVTCEIVHDSQGVGSGGAFQDDEIWLELLSMNSSGFPLGTHTRDCKSSVIASPADQASSSVTWTTTGLTTPVKQKLEVTITPQEKGYIMARVCLAKANKTVYVCPELAVA